MKSSQRALLDTAGDPGPELVTVLPVRGMNSSVVHAAYVKRKDGPFHPWNPAPFPTVPIVGRRNAATCRLEVHPSRSQLTHHCSPSRRSFRRWL